MVYLMQKGFIKIEIRCAINNFERLRSGYREVEELIGSGVELRWVEVSELGR